MIELRQEDFEIKPQESEIPKLRGGRDLEIEIEIIKRSEPSLRKLELEWDPFGNDGIEGGPIKRSDSGENKFVVSFRPKQIARAIQLHFKITGFSDLGIEYVARIVYNQCLRNPFVPFDYDEKKEGRGIAERQKLQSNFRTFLYNHSEQRIRFLVGPPGSGKTTFLFQFRRWAFQNLLPDAPFPLIVIAHPPAELDRNNDIIWHVDKAIHEDIVHTYCRREPFAATAELRERLDRIRVAFNAPDSFPNFPSPAQVAGGQQGQEDPYKEAREWYRRDFSNPHNTFERCLGEIIENLGPDTLFVLAIDDLHCWTLRRMTQLFDCMNLLEHFNFQFRVVISIRHDYQKLFEPGEREHASKALSCREPISPDPSFRLSPLDLKQIRTILKNRLPNSWNQWWTDDLIAELCLLTAGNPQAVEAVLFHWWDEVCDSGPTEQERILGLITLADKQRRLETALNRERSRETGELDDPENNSIYKLWKRYLKDLESREATLDKSREHLKALAVEYSELMSIRRRFLNEGVWHQGVGEVWDKAVVNTLEELDLVVRTEGSSNSEKPVFGLKIPVLSIPILREERWS